MDLDTLAALCAAHGLTPASIGDAGLVGALFLAGLSGSAVHCGPMCGPLVLAQSAGRLAAVPAPRLCELARLRSGLLLPYHLGRLATYGSLGAAAASFGAGLSRLPWFRDASAILLMIAAGLFLYQGLARATGRRSTLSRLLTRTAARFAGPGWLDHLALGLVLGLLPCGFLYAALAAASGTANPALGAIAMIAFGLGTVPMLALIGVAGHAAMNRLNRLARAAGTVVMTVNALILLGLAVTRLFT
ncbi:MAG TPA: sulfite exporter TauE/SafE family protein [Aliidongia sp.]|nr:sulfite exporter TauE/SafE family protein [Aliidongia sp.]